MRRGIGTRHMNGLEEALAYGFGWWTQSGLYHHEPNPPQFLVITDNSIADSLEGPTTQIPIMKTPYKTNIYNQQCLSPPAHLHRRLSNIGSLNLPYHPFIPIHIQAPCISPIQHCLIQHMPL